jgi:hypothetical protein
MSVPVITTVLTAAASYDLTDLQTVKGELNITDPASDAAIGRWITAVSLEIRQFCNRIFQVETVRDSFFPQRDAVPQVVTGGTRPLQLTRRPLINAPSTAGIAPPVAPTLSAVAGGALAATKYFAAVTYVTSLGETPASSETVLAVAANSLLQVAAPALDFKGLATGYNVYVSAASGAEIKQNTTPIAIGTPWTEPTSGLVAGTAMPPFTAVVENAIPLGEGVDFLTDAQPAALLSESAGQLTRLDTNGWPKKWPALPITVQYSAGYTTLPADVVDAAILLVKHRWFSRGRDPYLRQENIPGVYEASYWIAQGPGTNGNLPPDVEDKLEKYRVPVFG